MLPSGSLLVRGKSVFTIHPRFRKEQKLPRQSQRRAVEGPHSKDIERALLAQPFSDQAIFRPGVPNARQTAVPKEKDGARCRRLLFPLISGRSRSRRSGKR